LYLLSKLNRYDDSIKCFNIAINIKPIAIIYLSDEYGNEINTTILQNYTKILFRQYNHNHYKYGKNNLQMPLGYSKFFLNSIHFYAFFATSSNSRKGNYQNLSF
jgi:hypothetical protein